MMRQLFLTLLVLASPTLAPAVMAADGDAWGGLEEPLDEAKLAEQDAEGEPDLTPLDSAPENAGEESEPEKSPLARPAAPDAVPSAKLSKEEQIQSEYDAYIRRKEEDSEEDRMRQRLFHEGSHNNFAFDVAIDELAKFNRGQNSGYADSTYGISFGYNRVPWRSRYFGRLSIGLQAGVIGVSSGGAHFRVAFIDAGPRVTYEMKFLTAQILVPVGFIGYDHVRNQIEPVSTAGQPAPPTSASEDFNTLVYGGGILLNLNRLDSGTGTQALVSTGIRKFNLAVLFVARKGDSADRSSNHMSFGLRFEY